MIRSADQMRAEAKPGTTGCEFDVVILGGSITAWMAASYLAQNLPELKIVVLGPNSDQEKRPIVGESLVEPAAIFFERLGLGDYLKREQAVKNGLSFYHKFNIDDPADRRYSVHAPEQLFHLSRQLHRPGFDDDLRKHALEKGATHLNGKAVDIAIGPKQQSHVISAKLDSESIQLKCRWVIDATGRRRWLGKQVTQYIRPEKSRQRSCFWFRLADFEPFSERLKTFQRRPLKYDLWYTTHHFMGHGNWVWGIPLQSDSHERMISVGLTYRPDVFDHSMKSIDDFLSVVDATHPAISEMVRSGQVLDTNIYNNYLYRAEDVYSADGWFLIGDAARSVDPLYSTGLSMCVVQIEQVGEIISRELGTGISEKGIQALGKLWLTLVDQQQDEITDQYASMHDPFQACMRRYWGVCSWFNGILPLWWNGYLHNVESAEFLQWLFDGGKSANKTARRLFSEVSKRLPADYSQAEFDKAIDFDWLINPRFDCPSEEVPSQFGRLIYKRAIFRWTMLRKFGFRSGLGQLPAIGFELALSQILPFVLRRSLKRKSVQSTKSRIGSTTNQTP